MRLSSHKSLFTCLALFLLCFSTVLAVDNTDYYKTFDLDRRSFDKERLHKAYRKLAKQHHPDKNKGDKEAEAKFVQITKAFEVLNDDQKRRIYDQFGAEAVDRQMNGGGGGGHPFDFAHAEDIFNSFFGGGGSPFDDLFGFGGQRRGGHHQQQRRRSPDVKVEMKVTLEALYKGETVEAEIRRQQLCKSCKGTGAKNPDEVRQCDRCHGQGMETVVQQIAPGFISQSQRPCSVCQGKGRIFKEGCKTCSGKRVFAGPSKLSVKVEPGMQDGSMVKFPKMAEEHPDADVGDLYVVLRQEPHDTFTRKGNDLYTDFTLTLQEALLGFKKELKHLDGHAVSISRTDSVVQPDSVQKLVGEGMPLAGNPKRHGDLYVKFKVVFPQKLDKSQTTLLSQALRSSEKDEL